MDYKQDLTNGEGLPWQLAKRLCELNDWPLDSDIFYKSQREFREIIEHAWKAGEIQSRSTTTWKTNPCAGIFEDTYFMLGELEELLSKNLGYPVPLSFLSGRDEAVGDAGTVDDTVKPREGGYKQRDEFAIKQVKNKPELLGMRPGKIKTELQTASTLFTSGYDDWWRNNPIFDKGAPGRNPG